MWQVSAREDAYELPSTQCASEVWFHEDQERELRQKVKRRLLPTRHCQEPLYRSRRFSRQYPADEV